MFDFIYKWFRDLKFISMHRVGKFKFSSGVGSIEAEEWLSNQRRDNTDVYEYADAEGLEYAFQHWRINE